jgi:hypothetical protein
MVKVCILAFVSGVFFFFLILQSAWWLIPGVLTWTAIFVWQDRQEHTRADREGYDRGGAAQSGAKGPNETDRVEAGSSKSLAAPTKV